MPIALTEEHESLRVAARRFLDAHCSRDVRRAPLEAPGDELPPFWSAFADLGWLGLHVAEAHGGQGYGLAELAVVLEELGRANAPGPFLPTALAASVLTRAGVTAPLADLATGRRVGCVAFSGGSLVLGAEVADLVVLPLGDGDASGWVLVDARDCVIEPVANLDPTRRVARVTVDERVRAGGTTLPGIDRQAVRDLAVVLAAAEAVGAASWCVETAAEYAKQRVQFGHPIGRFQAVKHRLADMLVAVEQAAAVVWDAANALDGGPATGEASLAAAVAGALAPDAALRAAKDCIQVHGGIGFTWEHDAHLYLRRATAMRHLLGSADEWRRRVVALSEAGTRRTPAVELPPDAEEHRRAVRALVEELASLDDGARRVRLVEGGYVVPHWPAPWGRAAGPVEQLVIEEELRAARVRRPNLGIASFALPPIITAGTVAQQERWVRPTLLGQIRWCQLFSEPGAGSDLASLTTRATRVDGGWSITGQKVWTSEARDADWAICLARTNPDAPKHAGITYFVVDMRSPGVDVRPLRELTGTAYFNEVFLDAVFVPDDGVIGDVDHGWELARLTLANERVTMSSGASWGPTARHLLALVDAGTEAEGRAQVGGLVAEAQSIALLSLRTTLRAVGGLGPGPEASLRKLLAVEHEQRVQDCGLRLLGPRAATTEGDADAWVRGFLFTRSVTIAGGTSEIQRNVIGERLLGLPRDT